VQAKTARPARTPTRDPSKALERLYARLAAIDELIRCLEEYNRCRKRRLNPPRHRAA
jgi:hypothetical protein